MNGVRCARFQEEESSSELFGRVGQPVPSYRDEQPADDEEFERYRAQYSYDRTELNAEVSIVSNDSGQWRQERITIDAAYGGERVDLNLFLPVNGEPPYQVVVFWPGFNAISQANVPADRYSYLMLSGRGVLFPVYDGTFERLRGRDPEDLRYSQASTGRDFTIRTVNDLRRSLDYLETRSDIMDGDFAFYGVSWGARVAPIVLALEPRLQTAILVSGGLSQVRALPEADAFNFAPRVSVPVLMINGDQDATFPLESSAKPLLELLETPEHLKRLITFPGGHSVYSPMYRNRLWQQTLPWLDEHLGPVDVNSQ